MSDRQGVTTNILLICREGASREMYHSALSLPGVMLICVQSLMGFFRPEVYCQLSGILVDMPTYMRGSEEERRLLTELVGIFPALRLKCHEPTSEIRTLPFGTTYPGNVAPDIFVNTYCRSFLQRYIRSSERSEINMSAQLNRSLADSSETPVRSVAASVSCSGCFLISFEPWDFAERGWLIFPELHHNSPIRFEVRSVRAWGESRLLPGMGVCFLELSPLQKVELARLGGENYMLE